MRATSRLPIVPLSASLLSTLIVAFMGCAEPAAAPPPGAPDAPPVAAPGPTPMAADPAEPLFDPARVIEVDVRLPAADWDSLRAQGRSFNEVLENCLKGPLPDPFTYFRGTVTIDGRTLRDVGVRKKGFLGSLDTNRPSLKLKFDEFVGDQRLLGLKNFTLNNSRQDPSLLHQCLAYQTFAAAGVPVSRCNFAHVKVNGADLGVYVHVESAGKDLLRRHYPDATGNLYEGTLSDFREGWTATFEAKTNEDEADRADLGQVVRALQAPDASLAAALSPVLDLDRFLSFWATEVLIGHWDGYAGNANNFYAYHNPASGKFELIPWGTDATFSARPGSPGAPVSVLAAALLPRRLYLVQETRDRYLARLRELLGRSWNEQALLKEIDRMQALLSPIVDPRGDLGYGARVAQVRDFVTRRRGQIEAELAQGPPPWTAPLRAAPCLVPIGDVSLSLRTTFGTLAAPNPLGTGTATLSGTVSGEALEVSRAGAVAGMDPMPMPPPAKVLLRVVALLKDGSSDVVTLQIAPALFQAGASLKVDWSSLTGSVYHYNPVTRRYELRGLLGDGTLELTEAGAAPMAPVSASFKGRLLKQM